MYLIIKYIRLFNPIIYFEFVGLIKKEDICIRLKLKKQHYAS
jgi:hypothetical protein